MKVRPFDELLQVRASRGIIEDYRPATKELLIEPTADYKTLLEMVNRDPVIWTAFDLTIDVATYNGYDFDGEGESDSLKKKFEDELDFDQVIKNILWQMLIFGDAFLEVGAKNWKEGDEVTEIHPLPTHEMSIRYDKNGEILGYVQRPMNTRDTTKWIDFPTEKIIYFRHYWIGNRVYSYSQLEPAAKGYASKIYANNFLEKLFTNLHPKIVYFVQNASKDEFTNFIENVRRAKVNPAIDIVAKGQGDAKLLQYAFDGGLIDVLEYLRSEVLMVTRVPKIWVGMTDSSNRSTAEASIIPFETKVKRIQQVTESIINRELMPKINSSQRLRFNPISLMDEKSIFQNAQILSSLQIQTESEHPVITYLKSKAVKMPKDAKIMSFTEMQADSAPSRQRENLQTDKMGTNINQKGVSEAGGAKLQGKQLASAA